MCIDQNDQQDVQDQVSCMDRVYSFAIATIIVAGGTDGKGVVSCVGQSDQGPRLRVSVLAGFLGETEWSARGWTYQEFLLSRRLILFTSHGVYYHCSKNGGSLSGWALPSIEHVSCWQVYNEILTSYTCRKISRKSDTLNAITGTLRVLARYSNDTYVAGIPSQQMWYSLLWQPREYAIRQQEWPSWSWAGWTGPDDRMCKVFYPRSGRMMANHSGDRWKGKPFHPAVYKYEYHDRATDRTFIMASKVASDDESDRNLENCDHECTYPCQKLSHLDPDKDFFNQGGYLRFRARVVCLNIEPYEPEAQSSHVLTYPASENPPLRRYNILRDDDHGRWIGTIFLAPIHIGYNVDNLPQYAYPQST